MKKTPGLLLMCALILTFAVVRAGAGSDFIGKWQGNEQCQPDAENDHGHEEVTIGENGARFCGSLHRSNVESFVTDSIKRRQS